MIADHLQTYTLIHVLLSLLGIVAGLIVMGGLMARKLLDRWTAIFLWTTVLTSVTALGFPFHGIIPPLVVAVLSLVVLAVAVVALYARRLAGPWRRVFAITSVIALYFNVFVLVAQLFAKTPALIVLAPTQQSPIFGSVQLLVLLLFVWGGRSAVKGLASAA